MSGRFSVCRISNWRSIWAAFCSLVLGWSVAAQTAMAQDKASILERAEEVSSFLELLEHENSIVRQMSIADGLASDNRYIRDAAIEAGFNSDDVMVQKETLVGVLKTKPVFLLEVPVQLDERLASTKFAQWWSKARITVESQFFDPDGFQMAARGSGYTKPEFTCIVRGSELLCRENQGSIQIQLRPGVSGTLTGEIQGSTGRMPIVVRNF